VRYKLIFIATLYSSSPASAKLKTSHKRFARSAIEKFYRQKEKERKKEREKRLNIIKNSKNNQNRSLDEA